MNTPSIAQEINGRAAEKNVPLSVQVELTWHCNLACYYCYQREFPRTSDLPFEFWDNLFDQLAAAGSLYLTLTGGEPFSRIDIYDIVASARRRGFSTSLITNGMTIDHAAALRLAALGVTDVGVSFHAADPGRHDAMAGEPGSFQRALHAVRYLRTANVKTIIKHSVSSMNFGEYRALDVLSGEEGCLFEADSLIVPARPGAVSPYALTESQHLLFMQEMGLKAMPEECRSSDMLHCDAGRSLCGITAKGDLVPCIQLPLPFGNLMVNSFREIWNSTAAQEFRKKEKSISATCETCILSGSCSRCHGIAFLESGSWDGPSPGLCCRARASSRLDPPG